MNNLVMHCQMQGSYNHAGHGLGAVRIRFAPQAEGRCCWQSHSWLDMGWCAPKIFTSLHNNRGFAEVVDRKRLHFHWSAFVGSHFFGTTFNFTLSLWEIDDKNMKCMSCNKIPRASDVC